MRLDHDPSGWRVPTRAKDDIPQTLASADPGGQRLRRNARSPYCRSGFSISGHYFPYLVIMRRPCGGLEAR
jgi:hypothetical protein